MALSSTAAGDSPNDLRSHHLVRGRLWGNPTSDTGHATTEELARPLTVGRCARLRSDTHTGMAAKKHTPGLQSRGLSCSHPGAICAPGATWQYQDRFGDHNWHLAGKARMLLDTPQCGEPPPRQTSTVTWFRNAGTLQPQSQKTWLWVLLAL